MIRTRRIGSELFVALSTWRATLRRRWSPENWREPTAADKSRTFLMARAEEEACARVMALLNDDVGLSSAEGGDS